MNAGSLWAGTEYAWTEYRPRGSFPMHAIKVKVIKVQKVHQGYGPNATTVVEVEVLQGSREGRIIQVKARDIVNFWNEYEDERNHRREEQERREAERRERLRKAQEERLALEKKEADENQAIANALELRGIEKEAIRSLSSTSIVLDRAILISWLGLDVH